PPLRGRRVVTDIAPRQIFPYINENALFRGQWGFKQGKLSDEEFDHTTEEKARPVFRDLQRQASDNGVLQPKVVYGYFPVQSEGDELIVYHIEEFTEDDGRPLVGARLVSPSSDAQEARATQVSPLQCKSKPRELTRFKFPR